MRGPIAGRMQYPLVEQSDGDYYLETGNLVIVAGQLRFGSAEDVNLYRNAANQLRTDDAFYADSLNIANGNLTIDNSGTIRLLHSSNGFIEGVELAADPAAPPANRGRLYFRDNGAGKTQLVARFPTGAVQVIATEP